MIEVEVKLPITDPDMIKKKIQEIGFKEACFVEERDTYFDNANGEIRANGEALRVRETIVAQLSRQKSKIFIMN